MPDLPDRRFEVFDAEIRQATTQVISFDCFDSVLWRRVPKPTDLHLLVGEQLRDAGVFASHITPAGYAQLRILAEQEARRLQRAAIGSNEVTLEEIHEVLEPAVAGGALRGLGAATELRVESENVFADTRLARYLGQLSEEVLVPLVIVSDTYFSGDQLRSLLARPQLRGVVFESVYTSSDARTGKGDLLWEKVLHDLRIEPDRLVHVGDNEEADVSCARRLGIRAFHYPTQTARFGPVEIRERIVGGGTFPTRFCDPIRGDAGIASIRRRATWTAPGRDLSLEEQIAWETGTSIFGPVLTGFAEWIHEQAEADGIGRLLFMMREGKFLRELADRASGTGISRPTMQTAWVSREACARASIYEGSAGELQSFLARLSPPSPPDLAESLGLGQSDIPGFGSLCEAFSLGRDQDKVLRTMLDAILGRPDLIEKVVATSAERRRHFKEYLRRLAGPGDGPIGLVDVGWSGRIQESLETMFAQDEEPLEFRGLYLLVNVGTSERVLRGVHMRGFLGTVGTNPFDIAGVTVSAEIIELVSTCEEGSLLEMGANDRPILAAPLGDAREDACRDLVQQGALAYQRERRDYLQPGLPTFETSPVGIATLSQILKRFVSLPNEDEAAAFSWWLHEENYGSQDAEQLVPPRYLPTLRYRSAEDLHLTPTSDLHWTGGAAALVDEEMSDAILVMLEATIDPGRFSSPPEGTFRLSVATPDQEGETIGIPVVRNRRGLSLVEWRGDVAGATRIVLRPAQVSTLVRLDLVEVVDEGAKADVAALFRWSKEESRQALQTTGVQWFASQVMAVDGSSVITVDLPTPVTSGALRVSVAGAFLQVSADPLDVPETNELETENAALRQEIDNLYRTKLFRFAAVPRRIYGTLRRR